MDPTRRKEGVECRGDGTQQRTLVSGFMFLNESVGTESEGGPLDWSLSVKSPFRLFLSDTSYLRCTEDLYFVFGTVSRARRLHPRGTESSDHPRR